MEVSTWDSLRLAAAGLPVPQLRSAAGGGARPPARRGRPRTRDVAGGGYDPNRRRGRPRRAYSESDSSDSSSDDDAMSQTESGSADEEIGDAGPPVAAVLARRRGGGECLVEWAARAPVRAGAAREDELRAGAKAAALLKQYERAAAESGEVASNAGSGFCEPVRCRYAYERLRAERILARRVVEVSLLGGDGGAADSEYYVPGFPVEQLGGLGRMEAYDAAVVGCACGANALLRSDGIYVFSESVDGALQLDTQSTKRSRVEYLVAWKNGRIEEASWESDDTLEGEVFRCVNVGQFQEMKRVFERRRGGGSEAVEMGVPDEVPRLRRDVRLTQSQREMVMGMFRSRAENRSCQVVNEKSGRFLAVVEFLDVLYEKNCCCNTTLIITEERAVEFWKNMLNNFSGLKWMAYFGDSVERQAIRESGFESDGFDVVLISPNIFFQDKKRFKNFVFDNVVVDCVYSGLRNEWKNVVDRIDKFTIFIGNTVSRYFTPLDLSIVDDVTFTETIVMAPNLIDKVLSQWIISIFHPNNSKNDNTKMEYLVYKLYLLTNNIFRVLDFCNLLLKQFRAHFNIDENTTISEQQLFNFYMASNGKLKKLIEMIESNDKKSLVVSDDLSDLRVISKMLDIKGISNGFAFSNNKDDRISSNLSEKIILTTRDVSIFELDSLIPEQIIFFDISKSFKSEKTFIQFITRNCKPEIFHLITDNSIEIDLFCISTLKDVFDFSLIRTPDQLFKTAFYHLNNKIQRTEVKITFPKDIPEIPKMLKSCLTKNVTMESWEMIFGLSYPKQQIQQQSIISNNMDWRINDFIQLLSLIRKYGISNWDNISNKIYKPINDTVKFGKSILLCLITQAKLNQYNAILNSILWYVFNTEPYNENIDFLNYWNKLASSDPNISSSIFTSSTQFSKALHSINVITGTLESIYKHWVIQSFLSVRKENYIPLRCMLYGQTQQDINQILQYYLENGDNWKQVFQLNIPPFIKNKIELYFTELFTSIVQDLYSFILHKLKINEIEQLSTNQYLKPLINSFQCGPFIPYWTCVEHQTIIESLLNYYIPLTLENEQDWEEFHAITKMTTKSTDMIHEYVSFLVQKIKEASNECSIVLDSSSLNVCSQNMNIPSIRISDSHINFTKKRIYLLENIRQLSILPELIYKDQIELSNEWNAENDKSLIQGICQFGLSRASNLWCVQPQYYQKQLPYDIIQEHSLINAKQTLQNKEIIDKRLNYLITINLKSTRNSIKYGESVEAINVDIPAQLQKQSTSSKENKSSNPPDTRMSQVKEEKPDQTEEASKLPEAEQVTSSSQPPKLVLQPVLKFSYEPVPKILFKL